MFTIHKEKTYTVLPSPVTVRVEEDVFKKLNIEDYKIMTPPDMPDEVAGYCDFAGHRTFDHYLCIESHIDAEQLKEYAQQLTYPSKYGKPVMP